MAGGAHSCWHGLTLHSSFKFGATPAGQWEGERIDPQTNIMDWAEEWVDGTWAASKGDVWVESIERATEICNPHGPRWIDGNGMVLKPERFKFWGETPAGALAPIKWIWKDHQPPKPSVLPNHKSATLHATLLGQQLDDAERMGMVESYDPKKHGSRSAFACNVIPLGARVKPSGSIRMLVDPSLPGINEAMMELPCTLPTVEQIFKLVKPTSVLGKRDLQNGFFHVTLDPDARRYMGYTHPVTGQLYRWIVLPQGTKQSPAIFCAVSDAACRIFNKRFSREGISAIVVVYVDDYIIIADTHRDMRIAFAVMDEEAALLGMQWNPKKDMGRDSPLTSVEVLGIIIEAPTQMLKLPDEKRARYLQEVQTFLMAYRDKESAPVKVVESLIGKLLFACRVCRWGYLFTQEFLDQVYPGLALETSCKASQVRLTEGIWYELSFWDSILQTTTNSWSGIRKHMVGTKEVDIDPRDFDLEIFTDASKTYGVGGTLGHEAYSRRWERDVTDEHIGALELEALLRCLQHWRDDLAQLKVIARMDNTQAVAALNKGASRKPALRDTLLQIAKLGLEYGFEVKAVYIKGELNPADAPSRGKRPTSRQDWTFMHFAEFNSPAAEVDCCAAVSGYNAQPGCTTWYSAVNPVQAHVRDLAGKVLWANIPFAELDPILDALVAAWRLDPVNTVATAVVPEWPTAKWYRKYIRRKRPLFKLLHRYEPGSLVFRWKNSSCPANPIRYPILVLRLGTRT